MGLARLETTPRDRRDRESPKCFFVALVITVTMENGRLPVVAQPRATVETRPETGLLLTKAADSYQVLIEAREPATWMKSR
jgi:hypothetical protein